MVKQIMKFICGYCNDKGISNAFTRKGLRLHLASNHIRNKNVFNSKGLGRKGQLIKRREVKVEVME